MTRFRNHLSFRFKAEHRSQNPICLLHLPYVRCIEQLLNLSFCRLLVCWASSNWKKTDAETFMALASSIINLNDGCFSPRSILPKCLGSVPASLGKLTKGQLVSLSGCAKEPTEQRRLVHGIA